MMTEEQRTAAALKLIDCLDNSWTLSDALSVLFSASIALTSLSAEYPAQVEYQIIESTGRDKNGVYIATLRAVPHKMQFRGN